MDQQVKTDDLDTGKKKKKRSRSHSGPPCFDEVRQLVSTIIRGRIVVGYDLDNTFEMLKLAQPPALLRDTSLYKGLRKQLAKRNPGVCPRPLSTTVLRANETHDKPIHKIRFNLFTSITQS